MDVGGKSCVLRIPEHSDHRFRLISISDSDGFQSPWSERVHVTPLTDEAVAALEEAREHNGGKGNVPVVPALRAASKCIGRCSVYRLWLRAQTMAGLEPKRGRGWHSLRRKFASDLMDQPLARISHTSAF